MDKPHIADAPGLAWRPRSNGWAAVWLARQDIAKKGFKPSTQQLAIFTAEPSESQADDIRASCVKLQEEMYEFGHEQPRVFGGTVRALIHAFETDPDSGYAKLEYDSRRHFHSQAKHIDQQYGHLKLSDLGGRDFKRWYEQARWPKGDDGTRGKVSTGAARMSAVRRIFSYGMIFEVDPNCAKLRGILSEMKFENGKARTEAMTLRQCEDIIAAAHAKGFPSIALAQAAQFDLCVRQRDVIGRWTPASEPGISVIPPYRDRKWSRGLRWEEISSTMQLAHPISKSRRFGKVLERDLTLYPMILAELARIPVEKRRGPVVVCELTGRPWKQNNFRDHWRRIATAAGVPKGVWNMDSRAGRITEIIEATGGNLEAARKEAEHSELKQTANYSRRKAKSNADTAVIVADFRAKNKA